MMTSMVVGERGELTLPSEIQERYGLKPDSAVRIVETRGGILLIPLAGGASPELAQEIADWQMLGEATWQSLGIDESAE